MRPGDTWTGNLSLPAPPRAVALSAADALPTRAQLAQFRKEMQRLQHYRHADAKKLPPER